MGCVLGTYCWMALICPGRLAGVRARAAGRKRLLPRPQGTAISPAEESSSVPPAEYVAETEDANKEVIRAMMSRLHLFEAPVQGGSSAPPAAAAPGAEAAPPATPRTAELRLTVEDENGLRGSSEFDCGLCASASSTAGLLQGSSAYECVFDCGFCGTFSEVAAHEGRCCRRRELTAGARPGDDPKVADDPLSVLDQEVLDRVLTTAMKLRRV